MSLFRAVTEKAELAPGDLGFEQIGGATDLGRAGTCVFCDGEGSRTAEPSRSRPLFDVSGQGRVERRSLRMLFAVASFVLVRHGGVWMIPENPRPFKIISVTGPESGLGYQKIRGRSG